MNIYIYIYIYIYMIRCFFSISQFFYFPSNKNISLSFNSNVSQAQYQRSSFISHRAENSWPKPSTDRLPPPPLPSLHFPSIILLFPFLPFSHSLLPPIIQLISYLTKSTWIFFFFFFFFFLLFFFFTSEPTLIQILLREKFVRHAQLRIIVS